MKSKIIIAALIAFVLTCLFPPWLNVMDVPYRAHQRTPAGFGFIFIPPKPKGGLWGIQIDTKSLFVEWAALAALTSIVWIFVVKPPWLREYVANDLKQTSKTNSQAIINAVEQTQPKQPVAANRSHPIQRRGGLMVVDDEEGPREALRLMFEKEYDLFLAEDGPTAIELVKRNDIDVVVTNIHMPGMSGIELLEQLKILKPDIEVIICTAYETTDTIRRALQLRACDYINKPFDFATMHTAVSKAMRHRTLHTT